MNSLSGFTFPRENRLNKSSEYEFLFKNGKRVNTANFVVIFRHNKLGYPRFGYVVSKKVSGKAVRRNRIKRILREYFRHNRSSFVSVDIIVVVKRDVSELDYSSIKRELNDSLKVAFQC